MADAEIRLSSGQAGAQFRDLSRKLRAAGAGDLRKKLRAEIAKAGKPVVAATQDAVRTIPITSEGLGSFAGDFRSSTTGHGGGRKQRRRFTAERARTERSRTRALSRGGSLREAAAKSVKLRITNRGIQIVADSSAMPENQRTLPRHLDSAKGWRHPVFGNREVWVSERGAPWFGTTIKKHAPDFRAAVVDAMELARDAIEGN